MELRGLRGAPQTVGLISGGVDSTISGHQSWTSTIDEGMGSG